MSDPSAADNVPPAQAAVLPYAANPPRLRRPFFLRHFHVWLLPFIWLPAGWGSRIHYGDEYGGFVMANLAAIPVWLALTKVIQMPQLDPYWGFVIIIATSFALCAGAGWLLDRLRAWKWIYLLVPVAFVMIVKSHYAIPGSIPSIAYYPGQEWQWDAVFVAYSWSVWLVALVTLVGAALVWIIRIGIKMSGWRWMKGAH
jgi:hypothetical protein